jgi:hypothetical protein
LNIFLGGGGEKREVHKSIEIAAVMRDLYRFFKKEKHYITFDPMCTCACNVVDSVVGLCSSPV